MKKHVLLIDDDREQLNIFMNALGSVEVPCKCTYVNAYDHALKMLEFLRPDCIFLRIDLNGQDAIKFLSVVKNTDKLCDINVVMYADDLNPNMIRQAIFEGAAFCLGKPKDAEELQQLLTEIFVKQNPMYAVHKN